MFVGVGLGDYALSRDAIPDLLCVLDDAPVAVGDGDAKTEGSAVSPCAEGAERAFAVDHGSEPDLVSF